VTVLHKSAKLGLGDPLILGGARAATITATTTTATATAASSESTSAFAIATTAALALGYRDNIAGITSITNSNLEAANSVIH